MKIVAMLAWYDEFPELLTQCAQSVAPFVDIILATDGAYELTPDAKPESPDEQYQALLDAAPGKVVFPKPLGRLWRGQVEKRSFMLREGVKIGADWLIIVDADWKFTGDPIEFRRQLGILLEQDQVMQLDCWFREMPNPHANLDEFHEWHVQYQDKTVPLEIIFRAMPGMKCEKNHWTYSGLDKNGIRVGLMGGNALYHRAMSQPLYNCDFLVEHYCLFRDHYHIRRNLELCERVKNVVDATGREPE